MLRSPPNGSGDVVRARPPAGSPLMSLASAGVERPVLVRASRPGRWRSSSTDGHEHARRAATAPAATSRRASAREAARARCMARPGMSSRATGARHRFVVPGDRPPFRLRRRTTRDRSPRGSVRVPGQAALRAVRHPRVAGRAGRHRPRGGRRRRPRRLPGRRQGAGAGRRPGQGRRHQARRRRRRGPHPRRGHPRHGHQGPHRRASSGSSRRATSPRSTTRRSRSTAPPSSTSACSRRRAASRSSRSPRRTPTRSPGSTSTPSTGSPRRSAARGSRRRSSNPAATDGAVDILLKLYRAYIDGDADLVEINPLILTPDGQVHALDAKVTLDDNAVFRHPDYVEYDATQVRDAREQFAHEQGPAVRRARRLRRHHRQRRRARDEHGRHREPGRRRARRTSSTSAAARTPT